MLKKTLPNEFLLLLVLVNDCPFVCCMAALLSISLTLVNLVGLTSTLWREQGLKHEKHFHIGRKRLNEARK